VYGDYLFIALQGVGLVVVHRDRPDLFNTFKLTSGLQRNPADFVRLRLAGSLLFASAANGGVVVFDVSEPLEPYVVSAGNSEIIEASDHYKDRLLTVTSQRGVDRLGTIRSFDLPASFVSDVWPPEDDFIADD
jgi:hypothetical protein